MPRWCPADCSRFENENQTNRAGGVRLAVQLRLGWRTPMLTRTNTYWAASLWLINSNKFSGIQEYLLFITTDTNCSTHSHTTPTLIFINRLVRICFGKPSVLSSRLATWNSARASRSFAISHLYKLWDESYLNNTVVPLKCKTNTVHIFAGLSAFSCFIGILQCTFFSQKWIWIWDLGVKYSEEMIARQPTSSWLFKM